MQCFGTVTLHQVLTVSFIDIPTISCRRTDPSNNDKLRRKGTPPASSPGRNSHVDVRLRNSVLQFRVFRNEKVPPGTRREDQIAGHGQ